jgi:hypothetical protein
MDCGLVTSLLRILDCFINPLRLLKVSSYLDYVVSKFKRPTKLLFWGKQSWPRGLELFLVERRCAVEVPISNTCGVHYLFTILLSFLYEVLKVYFTYLLFII